MSQTFEDLNIIEPILKSLKAKGYVHPTPIQAQAIPLLLDGKDLLGCAQTGTGKTAAFAIPIIQQILANHPEDRHNKRKIKAIVITPTRELAIQIADNFTAYSKHTGLRNTVIFGGVKQFHQVNALRHGVDILVATPGRLLDLMNQGIISLKDIEHFTLDEADHMLEMGFIHDIKKVMVKLPKKRQSLFFSATMPKDIAALANSLLTDPASVTIEPEQATAERVSQAVCMVSKANKIKLLEHILSGHEKTSTIVFGKTKHGCNKVVKELGAVGIVAEAIHGNKSQAARQKALKKFKAGEIHVLVATDIAARGIDVSGLGLVINYELPNIPETYVHRIGRTGRAKASGTSLSFCDCQERGYLRDIEKLINQKIPVIDEHPYVDNSPERAPDKQGGGRGRGGSRGGGRGNSGGRSNFRRR